MDCCIHESEGAFISGCQISDNVLVAYEALHILKSHHLGRVGQFALKLNISKAYDKVEWGFLVGMLVRLGFHRIGSL